VEYNEYTGTYSHQKGPKSLMMIHVDTSDKPWASGVTSEATYLSSINSLSQRYYDSSGHQTWVGDKRKGGLTIPRFQLTPVVRLPNASSYYTDDTFWTLFTHAIAAVKALGGDYAPGGRLDPDKFDRIMINSGSFKAISSQGLAYVGGRYSWPGGAYEHELGHNWGLYHANFWKRPTGSVLPRDVDGSSVEYGDGADIMGGGSTLFSPVFKDTLGFLEASRSEIQSITASGTYRLYSHTQGFVRNATNQVRALKLQLTSGGSPAYLGFRYETSGTTDGGDNRGSRDRNAVQFHWNVGGANFIDTTPDSRKDDDKIDGSIKLGRTYSEPATSQEIANNYGGLHITPVARGSTTAGNVPAGDHQYIDVVINRGSDVPVNNAAPAASFAASTINATAGSPVALSVTASDPNGDALAYDWDFGNGAYNITNSAAQSPAYASAGLYLVRCTVSDMKGQTTTVYQWVNVGGQVTSPATPTTTLAGLHYRTYSGTWSALPNFDQLQPTASGTCTGFDLSVKPGNDNFAILYTGYLDVPVTDIYQFEVLCDDGAKLIIDGQTVITNDGLKTSALSKTGNIALAAGKHSVRLEYFHKDGTETLGVNWWRIGQAQAAIPSANLIQSDWAGNPAPVVSITAPTAADSFIVNSDITLAADATDAGGITKVVFFSNGGFLAEDTTAPYGTVWPKVSVGSQTITAIAYDATGRWTKSAPLTFQVVSPAPTNGIGLNFGAFDTARTLSFNEAAGAVYAYSNWNNLSTTTGSDLALSDHTGIPSSAKLTYAADGTRSGVFASNADTSTANGKMMRGGVQRDYDIEPSPNPNPYATITDIPYAAYDVYVYFDALETWPDDAAAQRYVLTPTEGEAPGARFGRNSLTANDGKGDYQTYDSWTGFREATATALNDSADKLAGNYIVFRNQTASGFKLESTRRDGSTSGTTGRHRRYFNAIQVMEVTPTAPALVVRQTGGSTAVSEAGTRDTVTVALAFAPTADVTVTVAPDAQLTADKNTLTFTSANWQTAQTVTVGAVNDSANEGPHTGTLTLTATGGNYTGLAARTLSATVTDDDQPTINVTAGGAAREAASPVAQSFRFARSGAGSLAGAVTVNFTLSGTADKAADYTLSGASVSYNSTTGNGTAVIPDGAAFVSLTLTPTNDAVSEYPEEAILTVNTGTGYAVGSAASATITITDDDQKDYFAQYFGTSFPSYGLDEYYIDLDNTTLTLEPDGSTNFYRPGITRNVTAFPTATSGHTNLRTTTPTYDGDAGAAIDGFWTVAMPATFYGTNYTNIHVRSSGAVSLELPVVKTFGTGRDGYDVDLRWGYYAYSASLPDFFLAKQVAVYRSSLNGATGNTYVGRVTTTGQERTVVTYVNVEYSYSSSKKVNAQIEFWDNGKITLTWLGGHNAHQLLQVSGLSNGSNVPEDVPSDFIESNLSAYPAAPGNAAPAFATVAPLTATVGTAYTYAVAATDPNGDTLTLTAPTKPSWLTLTDNGNGTATLGGTPSAAGSFAVTLRASDGTLTTDQSFTLTVVPVSGNTAPVFTSTPATTQVNVGQAFSYAVTSTDADGHTVTLSAPTLPGWLTFTPGTNGTGTLAGTGPDTDVVTFPVTLLASDGLTATAQSFTLTVNKAPVVTLVAPASGSALLPNRANALALAASITDDGLPASPGNVTTTWSQVSGPGTATFATLSAASTTATFSAAGIYRLRLSATDGALTTTRDVVAYVETDASAALASGLLGYWKFNEASGTTAADSSANSKNLTITGAVTFGPGVDGNAYTGTGTDNQYAENTTLGQPSQMTFSAWVRSDVSPGDGGNLRYLLAFRQSAITCGYLALPSGSRQLQFGSSHATQGVWNATGYDLPANEWVHVTLSYDQSSTANNPVLTINGQAVTLTRATAPSGSVNTTDATRIGGSGGNMNQAWKGRIDEARLHNRILTADEVALLPLTSTPNQAPVVTAALRDPLLTGQNTAVLVGTATDDGLPASPGALTTIWSQVSGPAAATLAATGELQTGVTFLASGTYVFRFTATDGELTTSADLTAEARLNAGVPTTISVTPATATVLPSATATFAATVTDQYNQPMSGQTIAWSVSGGGSINSSGNFTAGAGEGGPYTVTATSGSLSGTAQVTVFNNPPTISDIADRAVTEGVSTGEVAFTVGDSETAAAALTVGASSSNQSLAPNANIVLGGSGANRTVTVTPAANQSGTATITVTVSDGVKSTSDTFLLTVQAGVVTSIEVTPATATVQPTVTRQFTATVKDQNGAAMSPQPTVTWSATGAGSVNGSGLFTGGASNGSATVTATVNSVSGSATVTVTNTAPTVTVTSPATASVSLPDRTDSLVLTATATDAEVTPTVTWSQVSGPGTTTFGNASALEHQRDLQRQRHLRAAHHRQRRPAHRHRRGDRRRRFLRRRHPGHALQRQLLHRSDQSQPRFPALLRR
jgi:hypothetical protein